MRSFRRRSRIPLFPRPKRYDAFLTRSNATQKSRSLTTRPGKDTSWIKRARQLQQHRQPSDGLSVQSCLFPRARVIYILYMFLYMICAYIYLFVVYCILYIFVDISIYFHISRIYNIYIDIVVVIYIIYTICTY